MQQYINGDVWGMIFDLCDFDTQIALSQSCSRLRELFIKRLQRHTCAVELAVHASATDHPVLRTLLRDDMDPERCWIAAVNNRSEKALRFLLRRCNPDYKNHFALTKLCRGRGENVIPCLHALLDDPMTASTLTYNHQMVDIVWNKLTIDIVARDSRITDVFPEATFSSASKHKRKDIMRSLAGLYPHLCDRNIHSVVGYNGSRSIAKIMLPHVNVDTLQQLLMIPSQIPQRIMCEILHELKKRE